MEFKLFNNNARRLARDEAWSEPGNPHGWGFPGGLMVGLFIFLTIAASLMWGGSASSVHAEEAATEAKEGVVAGAPEKAEGAENEEQGNASESDTSDVTEVEHSKEAGESKEEGDAHASKPETKKVKKRSTTQPPPGGDPRGVPDVVVCSQNLKLFGSFDTMKLGSPTYTKAKHAQKIDALLKRFASVDCDVIAVQEVLAKTVSAGQAALNELATELRNRTNRIYTAVLAPPVEGQMTTGFLLAEDRVALQHSLPYGRVELPRISPKQRPRLFTRPPLEVQIAVKSRDTDQVKVISLVNLHFKSKRGGKDDPTGLEWETSRMEMAEGLRRIVESRHADAFASGESLLILLGDRNSNFDVASARILEGSLLLSSFGEKGPCRLSKRGVPLCAKETALPRKLFSVMTSNEALQGIPGTFTYQGEYSWLDDILMPAESLPFAWRTAFSEGQFDSGVVRTPNEASDHAMVYVKLNW